MSPVEAARFVIRRDAAVKVQSERGVEINCSRAIENALVHCNFSQAIGDVENFYTS
jgi:hypothetical protein